MAETMGGLLLLGDLCISRPRRFELSGISSVLFNCEMLDESTDSFADRKVPLVGRVSAIPTMFAGMRAYASMANNHSLDRGEAGLLRTVEVLRSYGVGAIGYQDTEQHIGETVRLNDENVGAVCAVSSETSALFAGETNRICLPQLSQDAAIARVEQLRLAGICRIIVFLHWGVEFVRRPTPQARRLAHALIDAGASIVFGHHSHCPQGIEWYRGRLICYGAGNFASDGFRSMEHGSLQWKVWPPAYRVSIGAILAADGTARAVLLEDTGECVRELSGARGYLSSGFLAKRSDICFQVRVLIDSIVWKYMQVRYWNLRLRPRHILSALRFIKASVSRRT